jgi:hypothetical protein
MAILRPNRGSDAALGLALIAGVATFCATAIYSFGLALGANLIQLHLFERHPRISAVERVTETLCVILPVIISSIVAGTIYHTFRRRWSRL